MCKETATKFQMVIHCFISSVKSRIKKGWKNCNVVWNEYLH